MTLLVLLHIPKTAGTTLAAILHHHYGDAFFGGIGHDRATPRDRLAPNVFARFDDVDRRLRALAEKPKLEAIAAHITLGLHDRLPPDARYLTILRDPVERTLSHYYYLVQPPKAGRSGAGLRRPDLPTPPADLTLVDAFQHGYLPDNLQTRMLCGLVSPYDELPPTALEDAKRNLAQRLAYVGTTERFPEFLALLNLELGWPTVAYRRARANKGRPRDDAVPTELRRLAEERNALDRELYEHADRLLQSALQRAGPQLEREAEVLRRAAATDVTPLERQREWPLDIRVELARKEAELAEATLRIKRLNSRLRWRVASDAPRVEAWPRRLLRRS